MLIAGILCLGAAIACAVLGLRSLSRPGVVLRSVAPTQLAAAVILAAGGAVALAGPRPAAVVLVGVCVLGALGTVAAGSWQSARYALRREATPAGCGGGCAACTLSCR
ncbi:hypothetical protein [Mycobacterium celatum]|uniref:Transmembrane protein n=1 Tax=Mycobacterium celatum TaxID=28045 RepID=A0A1X1RWC0_MYCCE|nr:hypothetical protein [Mycobacterium celatum]ORV18648.1 hypothetical protein AWB95_02570 [Mycobacterium celatum]PIB73603.1 hypothetical protein CQY23_22820 [Mycobacterium celatum]